MMMMMVGYRMGYGGQQLLRDGQGQETTTTTGMGTEMGYDNDDKWGTMTNWRVEQRRMDDRYRRRRGGGTTSTTRGNKRWQGGRTTTNDEGTQRGGGT
jgi:hypothetical protein